MKDFGRVIPAMVTPFDEDLKVDYKRAVDLAKRLVADGADALMLCGSTGEAATLSEQEKIRLLEEIVDAVGDEVFIWSGTGTNNTSSSISFTRKAEVVGVDGVMLVGPYYNKPPQSGIYEHFARIADATSLPVMLYNVPGRTAVNILPETVAKLAEIENIVAIKEASGNLDQVTEIHTMVPEDFIIYSGDDSLTLPIMAVGGKGVVSVTGNLVPGEMMKMIKAFEAGNLAEARRIHEYLYSLHKSMFVTTNPIPVKAALGLMGFDVGGLRLPLLEATESEKQKLKETLASFNMLAQ